MAINNPYIPGDPYSYDLKWIIATLKKHGLIIEDIDKTITDRIDSILAGREINIISTLEEMRLTDLKPGHTILTTGYYSSGDGGAGIYVTRAADPADVDDGGSLIIVGDTAAELCPIDASVNTRQFGCDGDDDSAQFQKLVDYCLAHDVLQVYVDLVDLTGGSVIINRGITSPDILSLYSRKNMVFKGVNQALITKNDDGFMFDATAATRDFIFDSIKFRGYTTIANDWNGNVDCKVFNCNYYINVHAINCTFNWLKCVYFQDGTYTTPMQGVYSENNLYSKCTNVLKTNELWVAQFTNDLLEDGGTFITDTSSSSNLRDLLITGCTIEGATTQPAIDISGNVQAIITDNYFEGNLGHIYMHLVWYGVISGNRFGGRATIPASSTIYCIYIPVTSDRVQVVTGNYSTETNPNTTLIQVNTSSPYYNANYSLQGDNGIETGGTFSNLPDQIVQTRYALRHYAKVATVDLTATIQATYPAITGGSIIARVKNGQVIINFLNVVMTAAISSGSVDLSALVPRPDIDYGGNISDGASLGARFWMTNTASLGIRGGGSGTFNGQLVYNI